MTQPSTGRPVMGTESQAPSERATHLVLGAGPIGRATARELAAAGHRVRVVTRSGSGPDGEHIEKTAADATDADRLTELADGCAVIYNCINPPYHRWEELWPPMHRAILAAAEN